MTKQFIFILSLLFCTNIMSQENKHTIFLSTGYGFKQEWGIYIDYDVPDIEIWADHNPNLYYYLGYEYNVAKAFVVGSQLGYEKVKLESYYTDESYAKKYVIGIHWLGKFPPNPTHMQLGGFTNVGRIT